MSTPHVFALAGLALATAGTLHAQQLAPNGAIALAQRAPIHAGTFDVSTGALVPASRAIDDVLYANNFFVGSFYPAPVGRRLIDEGRIPSTTSTDVIGTFDSYTLSELQIGYATDAPAVSVGGTGVVIRIELFDRYQACAGLATTDAPILSFEFNGPGSTTGGVQAFTVDIDVSSLGLCMRADGDGVYSNGTDDLFGWSFELVDAGTGGTSGTGPLVGADPNSAPPGDGTAFQNPAATAGTGLGTLDLVRQIDPGMSSCIFLGGYPAQPFTSFWFVASGDTTAGGNCIGCGLGDDRFEENDTVATATPIAYASYSGLVCDAENDWYSLTIAPGKEIRVDILFSTNTADLDIYLFDAATMTELDRGFTGTDNETVAYANCGATPVDVVFVVDSFSANCNVYDMIITDPSDMDDELEDNDSCDEAVPIPLGTSRNLVVRRSCAVDPDFYSVTLQNGQSVTVDVLFDGTVADINLAAFDISIFPCPGVAVAASIGTGSSEHITYTNTSGGPKDLVVGVGLVFGEFSTYDMVAKVTDETTVGELVCIGEPNSTGEHASLCVLGSEVALDNDVTFEVAGLPNNIFGFFVVSKEIGSVTPAGSEGTFCIASLSLGRYINNVLGSGTTGTFTFSPDLTRIPFSAGGTFFSTSAMAGDTINYQAWYRDLTNTGANTSNFSDAVTITFR